MNAIRLTNYRYMDLDILPRPEASPSPLIIFSISPETEQLPYSPQEVGEVFLRESVTGQSRPRIEIVVSLGWREKISPESMRKAGGILARWLSSHNVTPTYLDVDQFTNTGLEGAWTVFCEGMLLGAFQFSPYKYSQKERHRICVHLLARDNVENLSKDLSRILTITDAVNLARAWGHEPGNVINPVTLSQWVERLCDKTDLQCTILDQQDLEKIGAGGILAVGKGSQTPPRLITIHYPGHGSSPSTRPVVLVGKAITFDSGGYSMKDIYQIQGMKYDKAGAAAVIGVMAAAAQLKIKSPIVAVLPAAENMVSERAYRPDDIVTLLSGQTVEVVTTDSEGRLVLADALTYAQQRFHPGAIIDIATLTSGIITALGRVRAGLFSNHNPLADQLFQAGERTHELLWRMPLDLEYLANMRSEEADLKNSGGKEGHPIYGGVFLNHFVQPDIPWAHLDVTGMAETNKEQAYCPKGATGFGVRLLVDYLRHLEG